MKIFKTCLLFICFSSILFAQGHKAPKLCAALRGNGDKIFATLSAVSAITEKLGIIDAAAGSSSGSIVMAFYEAILSNPKIASITDPQEKRLKVSLLLKVAPLYMKSFFSYHHSGRQIQDLKNYSSKLENGSLNNLPIFEIGKIIDEVLSLKKRFNSVYRDPSFREFIYPTYNEHIDSHRNKQFFIGILNSSNWAVRGTDTFFRPSPFPFEILTNFLDSMLTYFSGMATPYRSDLDNFLNSCSHLAFGVPIGSIASLVTQNGLTCGQIFLQSAQKFHQTAQLKNFPSFIDTEVGTNFNSFPITGVYKDKKTLESYKDSRKKFRNAMPYHFDVNFKDFKIGYFGRPGQLKIIEDNLKSQTSRSFKSEKFHPLTNGKKAITWRTVLNTSPAEPGLSELRMFKGGNQEYLSLSGWADLSPTLILKKGLGCENVVYVTRTAPFESEFAESNTQNLGANEAEYEALYSPNAETIHPYSNQVIPGSVYESLDNADAIWCTDWIKAGSQYSYINFDKYLEPGIQAYNSPVYYPRGQKKFFQNKGLNLLHEKLDGCAPGKGELADWAHDFTTDLPETLAKAEELAKLKTYVDYHVEGAELEGRVMILKKALNIYDQVKNLMPNSTSLSTPKISHNMKNLLNKIVGSNGRLDYSDRNRLYHTLVFSIKQILGESIRSKTPIIRRFRKSKPYKAPVLSPKIEKQVAQELRVFDSMLASFGVGKGHVPPEQHNYTYPREMLNFLRQDLGIRKIKDLTKNSSAGIMPAIKRVLNYLGQNVQFPDGIPVNDALETYRSFSQSQMKLPENLLFYVDNYNRLTIRTYKPMCKCGSTVEQNKVIYIKGRPERIQYFYKVSGESTGQACSRLLRSSFQGERTSVGEQCAGRFFLLDNKTVIRPY